MKNVIYSLAYGDQPALICDLVDWARTSDLKLSLLGEDINGYLILSILHLKH